MRMMWRVSMNRVKHAKWLGVLGILCCIGCGGEKRPVLAPVSGVVTLDGEPLPDAAIEFHPEAGGRPSRAVTDSEGKYNLLYNVGVKGAQVGMNKVYISTQWPDGEPPPGKKDPIPPKYNAQTTLQEEVVKGRNTIDFALESK